MRIPAGVLHYPDVIVKRRRLPHWEVAGQPMFITFCPEIGHYELHSWVVMPNHVHLLLTPTVTVSKAIGSLKTATSKRANVLLRRTGKPFWQDESYDHLVRNDAEFRHIRLYIENNPVMAGLAASPEQYPWSSARRPERPPQAGGLPHKNN